MKISINLREGFKNDKVTIFNKQDKLFDRENVSTRTQIGLAELIEKEIPETNVNIKIIIESRGISGNKEIDLSSTPYIGISITRGNNIEWKLSEAPFMYM